MDQFPYGDWRAFALGIICGTAIGTVTWWLWLLTTRLAAGV